MDLNDISVSLVAAVISAGTAAFKSIRFVHEGEKGIKLRFGRAIRDSKGIPKIIEPGFAILIPFVDTLRRHHVRQNSYRFAEQRIMLKDGLIFTVSGMVVFKVDDVYRALFEICNIDQSIDDIAMAAVRDEVGALNHDELKDTAAISNRLVERIRKRCDEWGIQVIQFSLTDCAPTPETANLLNAEIGLRLRVEALEKVLKGRTDALFTKFNSTLIAALIGVPVMTSLQNAAVGTGSSDIKTPKANDPEHGPSAHQESEAEQN